MKYFDPSTDVTGDHEHPNDWGHRRIAEAYTERCAPGPGTGREFTLSGPNDIFLRFTSTSASADARNWLAGNGHLSEGDFVFMQSSARGADAKDGEIKLRYIPSLGGWNAKTIQLTSDTSPTALTLYNSFSDSGNRNFALVTSYLAYRYFAIIKSNH